MFIYAEYAEEVLIALQFPLTMIESYVGEDYKVLLETILHVSMRGLCILAFFLKNNIEQLRCLIIKKVSPNL